MPNNKQRMAAVAATAILVIGGAWIASMAKHASGNADDSTQSAVKMKSVALRQLPLKPESVLAAPAKSISNADLIVSIDGVRNTNGTVYVMIFDNAAAFMSDDYQRAVGFTELPASVQPISAEFPDLTRKAYAVSVFHDENSNQQFDMNGDDPIEGYGTSRAKNAYDELKFHRARVKPSPIGITMFYLN